MPGMRMSVTITSNFRWFTQATASSPLFANSISQTSFMERMHIFNTRSMEGSSSTNKIRALPGGFVGGDSGLAAVATPLVGSQSP